MKIRSSILFVFLCLCTLALSASARNNNNDDDGDRPKAWKDADDSYVLGKFEMAAILYEQAYRETGHPAALYNIAQAKRQAGKYAEAVVLYRSYLRVAPEDAPARDAAVRKIEELNALLKQGEVAKESSPKETLQAESHAAPPALELPVVPAPQVVHRKPRRLRWAFAGGAALFAGLGLYALAKDGEGTCTPDPPGAQCPKLYDTATLGWSLLALGAGSATFTVIAWKW